MKKNRKEREETDRLPNKGESKDKLVDHYVISHTYGRYAEKCKVNVLLNIEIAIMIVIIITIKVTEIPLIIIIILFMVLRGIIIIKKQKK